MDKLLFTTFLTFLAGFIAAVMSLVNLVNEKERKISEYRKDWVQSLRSCFSDLVAKILSLAANFEDQNNLLAEIDKADEKKIEGLKKELEIVRVDIGSKRHDLHQAWAMTRLHFKPDELEMYQVEQKYKSIVELIYKLIESNPDRTSEIRAKIDAEVNEFVSASRFVLKKEWEIVKKGEPAYVKTKRYSIWIGSFMFFLLLTIGIHTFIAAVKTPIPDVRIPLNNDIEKKIANGDACIVGKAVDQYVGIKSEPVKFELNNSVEINQGVPGTVVSNRKSTPMKKNPCEINQNKKLID